MGERRDAAVQGQTELRPLSAVPGVQLQDPTARAGTSRFPPDQVPGLWRPIRRDGRQEAAEHLLRQLAVDASPDMPTHGLTEEKQL